MNDQDYPAYFDWESSSYMQPRDTHVIYILEFEGGIVKVGQTIDIRTRISHHGSSSRGKGKKLLRYWAVARPEAASDEQVLIGLAHRAGGRTMKGSREWFEGVNALELIDTATEAFGLPDYRTHKYQPDFSSWRAYMEIWEDRLSGIFDAPLTT